MTSSYNETLSSGKEYESSENEKSTTKEMYSSNDTELPLIEEKVSEDELVANDPVEEFISEQEDAFSDVSDFSHKESIHVFSQSQKSVIPNFTESTPATQEVEYPELLMETDDEYVYSTQEAKAVEDFVFRGKPKDDIIGPESFLYSEKTSQIPSQQTANALLSVSSIIKRDLEDFSAWQRDVDWKSECCIIYYLIYALSVNTSK